MGDKFNYANVDYMGNDDYANFPIIVLKGNDGVSSYSIVHRFSNNGQLDYAVIGKVFAESLIESIHDYKDFISLLSALFKTSDKKRRSELLDEVKTSNFFKQVLFTQEGFDLISGKHFYTNGDIQKTIVTANAEQDGVLVLDSLYSEVSENKVQNFQNEKGVITEIKPFDSFEKYESNYFVNRKDFMNMSPREASLFVSDHYNKMINYINNNYPSFSRNASDISSFETQEEKIAYMAQLLDVLYDAQFGEKYSRQI